MEPAIEPTPPPPTPDQGEVVAPRMLGFAWQSWRNASVEGIWVLLGQVLSAIAGLVGIRILTELAPKHVLGQVSLLLGLLTIGRNFLVAPISHAQFRFHAEYLALGKGKWFTRESGRFTWLASALFALVVVVGYSIWKIASGSQLSWLILPATLILVAAESDRVILQTPLHAERRRVIPAFWTSIEQLTVVLTTSLLLLLHTSTESYVFGRALGTVVCLLIFGYLLYPRLADDASTPPPQTHALFLSKMLRFGLPFVPIAMTTWVLNLGDRYVLEHYMGDDAVGMYYAAYSLASQPFLITSGVLLGFAKPILYQAGANRDSHKLRKLMILWLGLNTIIVVIGVILFAQFGQGVARLLLAADYRAAAPPIFIWVGLGYGIYMTSTILELLLMALGHSGRLVLPAAIAAIFNVVANILLIPRWGLTGAAQVTSATFGLQMLLLIGTLYHLHWTTRRNRKLSAEV